MTTIIQIPLGNYCEKFRIHCLLWLLSCTVLISLPHEPPWFHDLPSPSSFHPHRIRQHSSQDFAYQHPLLYSFCKIHTSYCLASVLKMISVSFVFFLGVLFPNIFLSVLLFCPLLFILINISQSPESLQCAVHAIMYLPLADQSFPVNTLSWPQ